MRITAFIAVAMHLLAWAMVRQFLVSLARMFGTNTLPQALRYMANQLEDVSELLFGSFNRDTLVKSCIRSPANNLTPLVCSFDN
jgi:hypothetical protein